MADGSRLPRRTPARSSRQIDDTACSVIGRGRVLYVSHTGVWGGGAEVVLEQWVRASRRAGYEPHLACPAGMLMERVSPLCATATSIPMPRLRRTKDPGSVALLLWGWLVASVELTRAIRRSRATIVHANSGIAALVVVLAAVLTRSRLVWHQHDIVPERWVNKLVMGICSAAASAVLPCSYAVADSLGRLGVPGHKMHVMYNCVRSEFLQQHRDWRSARQALGLQEDMTVLTIIGRLVPRKRHDVFLGALRHLLQHGSDVCGLVVGDTPDRTSAGAEPYRTQLSRMADEPPLRGRVHFLGRREDVGTVLAASDILVMPSEAEPFALVVLEAFATGVPVVASDAGGHPESIENGVSGLLAPLGDDLAIAQAIRRLMDDPCLRHRIVKAARERVLTEFSEETLVRRLGAMYGALGGAEAPWPGDDDA